MNTSYFQPVSRLTGDVPPQMWDFQVFDTAAEAKAYLRRQQLPAENYDIVEYHDDDIEEPTYINRFGRPADETGYNPYGFIHHGARVLWNDPGAGDYGEDATDHLKTEYVVHSINGSTFGTATEENDVVLIYDPQGNYGEAEVPAHELREASRLEKMRITRYVREADTFLLSCIKFADRRTRAALRRAKAAEKRYQDLLAIKQSKGKKTFESENAYRELRREVNALQDSMARLFLPETDTRKEFYTVFLWEAPGGNRLEKRLLTALFTRGNAFEAAFRLLFDSAHDKVLSGQYGDYTTDPDGFHDGFDNDHTSWTALSGDVLFTEIKNAKK